MTDSIWKIPYSRPDSRALEEAGISPLLARVLASRGITDPREARSLLVSGPEQLHDPMEMLGMRKACERIRKAIAENEQVTVYGDYDVDGITATCLLTDYLRSRGVSCGWYIPDRDGEGYGLNASALQKLRDAGNSLVITVDCGITAVEEADFARSIGLDLIITDHHECRDGALPEACAVIDPKRAEDPYPNSELAGVGVAFKLACACSPDPLEILTRYADLVAVGTIADVMPLTGENRYLVREGLKKLEKNPRPGFHAMMNEPGAPPRRPTAGYIGFTMAPRLNAAGRLGQTEKAENLLLSPSLREAEGLAAQLRDLNRERQRIENEIWQDAQAQLKGMTPDGPIVLASDSWYQGVIGIAASRLADQYGVPTVMVCFSGDSGKGSCRSCSGFNLYQALAACSEYLESFGGHALAAGLNLRREALPAFREALAAYYRNHLPEKKPDISCDLLLCDSSLLSIENVRELDSLEPYGSANPRPVLCICDVPLLSAYGVGADKQHLKFSVEFDGRRFDGIFFSRTKEALGIKAGDRVDVAFTPQINEYLGNVSVQLSACGLRCHRPESLCEHIMEQDPEVLWAAASFTPSRSDFVRLWKYFGKQPQVASCLRDVLAVCPPEMEPERYCLCLAVFSQAGLLTSEDGRVYCSRYIRSETKADLDATEIMRILRKQIG
ncbi:MAG: single-stranded-DNA-specific exonuclease RecJ [Oscillospiraceae bacterium]|nr:single-stranded-DNA-specific exonuclease RecJ [Oscillospiraceae bacterium]